VIGLGRAYGRLHVIDIADLTDPHEVAWFEPEDGGSHNVWIAGDTLYMGDYQGGLRVLDISGELKGDLLAQGREYAHVHTGDAAGLVTGGYSGFVRVAAVAAIPGQQGQKIEFALVHVLPEPPARVDVSPAPTKLVAGTRLTLLGTAFSKHGDRRADLISFASS